MKNALFIAVADLRFMMRQKETLVWVFLMPIVFFYFIGTVTSGFGGGGGNVRRTLALEVDEEPGFLTDVLRERLDAADFRVVGADVEGFDELPRRLTVPARWTAEVQAGTAPSLRYEPGSSSSLAGDLDTMRVQRAVYTLLADWVAVRAGGEEPSSETLTALAAEPRALSLAVRSAGERKEIPNGFEQTIPGTMVMFTMIVLLTSGTVLLVIERRQGLLRRLASAPISRPEIVLGKWGGKMVLGLVQIAFGMLAGTVLFSMDWGPDLPAVMLLLFAWAGFNASLAMWVGSLAKTEGQAIGFGVLSANVLAALGGCWWPIEITPDWMQSLSLFLPTGWAMHAMHELVSFQSGAWSAAPHALALAAGALVLGALAVRAFRYQ